MKSAFVNMYHASVENQSMARVGGKDGKKQLVLMYPMCHELYYRAQVVMHHRMGDKAVHNYGLSREAAVALQILLEREWELAVSDAEKRMEVAQLARFLFLGFPRALRGDEISKIELTRILRHFEEGGAAQHKYGILSLVEDLNRWRANDIIFSP
jgi:hypothetical protein